MEVGDKLKELNMTVDEMDRLTKAFKDEKFREMLREYAEELSDPESKKRYEEEIKLLEQERGNVVEFIHPEPFRALRTRVNDKQKCFINICANEKLEKPSSRWGVSEEGRRGQCWSLPHSLHPRTEDTDPEGNKIWIYDVVFHPDTLYIASKNRRFMDMVDSTAIQGIQKAFNVTLDKNNVREISTKYKGTPHPCVIRRPTPGYEAKAPSEKPDPLAFPYPNEKRPIQPSQTKPTGSPATENSSEAEPKSFQVQPQKTKEPTKPNYTVKYRSFIDLQDFRCSRDSAQSPRPKEIVVTIDLPLLKAVTDASLEVKETRLLLESKKPAYRLELPLAYPVDEDKGEAKFNRQRGQLTVTLPVLPSNEAFVFAVGADQTSGSDDERQEEKSEAEDDGKCQEKEREDSRSEEERDTEEDLKQQQTREENGEEERGQEKEQEQVWEGENSKEEEIGLEEEREWKKPIQKDQESVEEEKVKEQKQENEREVGKRQKDEDEWICEPNKSSEDECDSAAERKDCVATGYNLDRSLENSHVAAPETEKQPVLINAELSSHREKEEEVNMNFCLEPTPKTRTSDIKEETVKTTENLKVETDAALAADTQSQNIKECCVPQGTEESGKMAATDEANKSRGGGSGNLSNEELAMGSAECDRRDNADEDDLPTEQIVQNPECCDRKPPPVLLREIDTDGNEEIISDHSTFAGFIFQNSLMFELD